jgi:hypothetical protein
VVGIILPTTPISHTLPVGAAAGCDLLICFVAISRYLKSKDQKIKRSKDQKIKRSKDRSLRQLLVSRLSLHQER